MNQITYSEINQENFKGVRADSELSVKRPTGDCLFRAVGAGNDKREAQVALHNVLQEIQDQIWDHILALRDEIG